MNERSVQAPAVAAAAALIGGIAVVIVPQHALTIVQLVVVTAAVAAALHVIVAVSGGRVGGSGERPYDRWARLTSPFRRVRLPEEPRVEPPEIERTRNHLDGQRLVFSRERRSGPTDAALAQLPPVPPEVVRRLARILRASLNHQGVDATAAQQGALQANLSPLSWAVLSADQFRQTGETSRDKRARPRYLAADAGQVSQVVHAVLDDVDRLQNGGRQPAQAGPPPFSSSHVPQTQSPRGSR